MKEGTLIKIIEIERFVLRLPLWPVFFCMWVRNELKWQRTEKGRMKKVMISSWEQVNFEDVYYTRDGSSNLGGFWKLLARKKDGMSWEEQVTSEGMEERGELYEIGILEDVFNGTDNRQWVQKDEADERGWKYDIADSMELREYVEDENGDLKTVEFEKPRLWQDGLVFANLGKERLRAGISIEYIESIELRIKCRQVYKVMDEKVLEILDCAGLRRGVEYYDDMRAVDDYEGEETGDEN